MSIARFLHQIGSLIEQVGPKAEKGDADSKFIECGPMQWADGQVRGRVYGPFRTEDEAHNYLAIKIERHRLSNASYHGEKGRAPSQDKEYFGHPMFQYRIMEGSEFYGKYLLEISNVAMQGVAELETDYEPEVFWPNGSPEDAVEGLLDGDEFFEEAGSEPESDSSEPLG